MTMTSAFVPSTADELQRRLAGSTGFLPVPVLALLAQVEGVQQVRGR